MIENIVLFVLLYTIYIFAYNVAMYVLCLSSGVRVDKFYVWYDFKAPVFKIKRNNTEFGLGWIPLGGYLKISGMLLEEGEELEPYHFKAASPIRQILIIIVGPLLCLIAGVFVYMLQLPEIPTAFYSYTAGFIGLIIALLFIYRQFFIREPKNNEEGESETFKIGPHFLSMFFLLAVLGASFFYVNELTPFFNQISAVLSGDQELSFVNITSEGWVTITAFFGVWFFISNMLPLGGLNGSVVVAVLYKAMAGSDIPEKLSSIYRIVTMPLMLGVYGYLCYLWLF